MLLILGIIFFIVLIIIHEYGHFLVAKRNGVEVEEFGIFFPPKLVGKTMGKGILKGYYTLNLIPLGGFVKLKGENDADRRKGSLGAARFKVKAKVMMAGVAVNFLAAMLLFTVTALIGMPKLLDNQFTVPSDAREVKRVVVAEVSPNSPAATAGIDRGDEIVALNGIEPQNANQIFTLTKQNAGKVIPVTYKHDDTTKTVDVQLNKQGDKKGVLGVGPADDLVVRSTWSAPLVGIGTTLQFTWLNISGLASVIGDLFTGQADQAADSVSGPVGVVAILGDFSSAGFNYLLFFIANISLVLAIMNALPIPALDGGRLAVTGFFRAIKKPLTPKLETTIHGTGFVLLLLLILLITREDLSRFFNINIL